MPIVADNYNVNNEASTRQHVRVITGKPGLQT